MKQLARLLLVFGMIGLLLGAAQNKDDANKKKTDSLEGTWNVTGMERGGQPVPTDEYKGAVLTIKGDKYNFKSGGESEDGTIKLDPAKKPKTIDLAITSGNDKDKNQLGIYEITGDILKVCVTPPGSKDRPTEFTTKADNAQFIFTLKRAAK